MMENQYIIDALSFYLDKNYKTHHALMITGEWGCGKTYFIKELITHIRTLTPYNSYKEGWDKCDLHKGHYISLYGIETLENLQKQLFAEFYPIKSLKNTLSSFLFNTTGVGASASISYFGKLPVSLSIKPQNVKITFSKAFKNLKEAVIIFDDLERCAIPVKALFGFINQLVEHNRQKVILIANEDKIQENNYKEIKEKLVGTTLELQTSPESVLERFIREMEYREAKICTEENKVTILDLFNRMEINNYRSLRQALYNFARLLSEVRNAFPPFIENTDNAKEARRQLLILVLVMDMLARANELDLNELVGYKKARNKQDTKILQNLREKVEVIYKKLNEFLPEAYQAQILKDLIIDEYAILPCYSIADFLLTSNFDEKFINQHIENHALFYRSKEEEILEWPVFLNAMFWCLDKIEFDRLEKRVKFELENYYLKNATDIFKFACNLTLWQEKFNNTLPFITPDIDSYFSEYITILANKEELFFLKHDFELDMQLGTSEVSESKLPKLIKTYYKLRQEKEVENIAPIIKRLLAGESFEAFTQDFPEAKIQKVILNINTVEIASILLSDKRKTVYGTKLYAVLQQWSKDGKNSKWFDDLKKDMEIIAESKEPPFKGIAKNITEQLFDRT